MRIGDWSSDVCSSDLGHHHAVHAGADRGGGVLHRGEARCAVAVHGEARDVRHPGLHRDVARDVAAAVERLAEHDVVDQRRIDGGAADGLDQHLPAELEGVAVEAGAPRSEEQTSELQSLMRNSYAALCLKKKSTN